MSVRIDRDAGVWTVILDRPDVRNAVDTEHAGLLLEAFDAFEADGDARVAVLGAPGAPSARAPTCAPWPTGRCARNLRVRGRRGWARPGSC